MNKEYWLSDDRSGVKEAVLSKIYNDVEQANKEFGLTKMEEFIVKGFINKLCA